MRAEDLQIGDWITARKWREKTFQITRINEADKFFYGKTGDTHVGPFLIEELEPIPLTPEILEKNGFGKFDFPNIEKQHKWYLPLDTLSYISLWTRELNDNSSNGWMCNIEKQPAASGCFMIVNIHDLQHLIKLAGIDKEIQI